MQAPLPLDPQLTPGQMHAHGVLIDFEAGSVSPASIKSLGELLARINRYGVRSGLRSENICTVLFHSYFVGRIAVSLAASGALDHLGTGLLDHEGKQLRWSSRSLHGLLGVYAGLHDLGEIFGGDLINLLPARVVAVMKQYQRSCQSNVMRQLGLPVDPEPVHRVLKVADLMAVPHEMELLPDVDRSRGRTAQRMLDELRIDVDPLTFVQPLVKEILWTGRFPRHHKVLRAWSGMMSQDVLVLSTGLPHLAKACAVVGVSEVSPSEKNGVVRTSDVIRRIDPEFTGYLHDLSRFKGFGRAQVWRVERARLVCVQEAA